MKTSYKLILAAIVPVMMLAACGGSDDDDLDDRLDIADPKVRLVHAVPLAPNVSLFRNDVAQASEVTNVAYKGASRYFDVDTLNATWEVRTATTPAAVVGSQTFTAERGWKYTLIAVPNAGSVTELALIRDPYDKSIDSNNARVRVFNASFNAANVDVYLTAPGVDLNTVTPGFAGVGYKQSAPPSSSDSTEVNGATYTIRITTAGTKNVIFSSTVELEKNEDWLLTTVPGSINPNDIKVLVIQSDQGVPATELTHTP
jgi:hypothetical protein